MALKRIMGTETEYGITGGLAGSVVSAYKGKKKGHQNLGKTNQSVVKGLDDIGGHIGGDYGTLEEQLEEAGHSPSSILVRSPASRNSPPSTRSYAHDYDFDPDDVISNEARFYVDMGHPEYSTPETSNPRDLVIADKAGELIVLKAAKKAGKGIKIYKDNSDGQGNSYGCHENYLIKRFSSSEFREEVVPYLLPFFVTRQLFAGSGKISVETPQSWSYGGLYSGYGYGSSFFGSKKRKPKSRFFGNFNEQLDRVKENLADLEEYFLDIPDFSQVQELLDKFTAKRRRAGEPQIYQLSQRADFFQQILGLETTHNRPIINTRDEPHADRKKYMRLHVICGDANLSEVATYLKTGTTSLVLDLIEDQLAPLVELDGPVRQAKKISRDQTRKWLTTLEKGKTMPAVDIQRLYLQAASKHYSGRDKITDDILNRWEHTLDALETDPLKLSGTVDWVIKLNLLTHLMEKHGAKLIDKQIKNVALQYHDLDREQGLFYFLQNKGLVERLVTDQEIAQAVHAPPQDTRAYLRGKAGEISGVSSVDWGGFTIKSGKKSWNVKMKEPFSGTNKDLEQLMEEHTSPEEFVEGLRKVKGLSVRKVGIVRRAVSALGRRSSGAFSWQKDELDSHLPAGQVHLSYDNQDNYDAEDDYGLEVDHDEQDILLDQEEIEEELDEEEFDEEEIDEDEFEPWR